MAFAHVIFHSTSPLCCIIFRKSGSHTHLFTKFHPAFPPAGEWGGPGPQKPCVSRVVSRKVVALRSEVVSCLITGQVIMGRCNAVPEGVTSVEGEAKDSITKFLFSCFCACMYLWAYTCCCACVEFRTTWRNLFSLSTMWSPGLLVSALTH